jgi:aminotransferase EvaB
MKKIFFNDLSFIINRNKKKILNQFLDCLNAGKFILGPNVQKFERAFAKYINVKYCIGVANGSDALEIALKVAGIKNGDKVGTVANASMYSTNAIISINATPIFLDVENSTFNTTFDEVIRSVKIGVKAIIITHIYGRAVNEIKKIAEYCKNQKVFLIEDCSQAHGAIINNKKCGTFGDISTFSFYPTKNLGAIGDGGAIATNIKLLANRANSFRQHGWNSKKKYYTQYLGGKNSRLDEIQAAMLLILLPNLNKLNEYKRKIALKYNELIKNPHIITPIKTEDSDHVNHLYVIRVKKRDKLKKYLEKLNISTVIHYPVPDYLQDPLKKKYIKLKLKNTEKLCKEVLSLPCYYGMPTRLVKKISASINKWKI